MEAESMPKLQAVHHISGEDGPTVGWMVQVDETRKVWCGEISRHLFESQDDETQVALGNDFGWFLVLFDDSPGSDGTKILARAVDEYSLRDLAMIYARGLVGWH